MLRVPPLDAYPAGYEAHREGWRDVGAGDVVLVCAGPLGRILAAEWFAHQPRATVLELVETRVLNPSTFPPRAHCPSTFS